MADNLTSQVRNIAQVTTAVANGDLTKKIDVDARGEILELKTTINTMVDQLSSFSSRGHPRRPRGRQRGPARRSGRGRGRLRHLEAADRERQRAGQQPDHARSARSRGGQRRRPGRPDPPVRSRRSGEVAELKDNVNLMVANLRETTRANQQQDWLEVQPGPHRRADAGPPRPDGGRRPDPARADAAGDRAVRRVLPGRRSPASASRELVLNDRATASAGTRPTRRRVRASATASSGRPPWSSKRDPRRGRARRTTSRSASGLGAGVPGQRHRAADPVRGPACSASIELASFSPFTEVHLAFFDQFVETIGVAINTIIANSRTEALLAESQRLTVAAPGTLGELQRQQAELRRPTPSWRRRPRCWPSRTARSRCRTPRSSRPAAPWRSAPSSSRCPRGTSPSSWPTCRTSCARR